MPSYEKQKNNKWSVRFWFKNNNENIQKRLSGFETKKQAEYAYLSFIKHEQDNTDNQAKNAPKISFKTICDKLINIKEKELKTSTINNLKATIEMYLLPQFDKTFADITKEDILNWKEFMFTQNLYKSIFKKNLFLLIFYI